ncbi:MAG: DUF1595 domain-containing protein, partial [Rhodobacteraceae bacterium]|nr:DUF1595 domain-containing protein [Paracoccaceae bacterium]
TMGQSTEFLAALQANARRLAREVIVAGPDSRAKRTYDASKIRSGGSAVKQDGMVVITSSRNRSDCVDPVGFIAPATGLYRISLTGYEYDNQPELRAAGKTWSFGNDKFGQRVANAVRNLPPPERPRLAGVMALSPQERAEKQSGSNTGGRRVGVIHVDAKLGTHSVECLLNAGDSIFIHGMTTARIQRSSTAVIDGRKIVVGEGLYIKQIGIDGPLVAAWPPLVQQSLVVKAPVGSLTLKGETLTGLRALLTRAFRRPVSDIELARYDALFQSSKAAGIPAQDAWRNVIEAVLCSPHFLYNQPLVEPEKNSPWHSRADCHSSSGTRSRTKRCSRSPRRVNWRNPP